jgi:hypothetical protein
VDIDGIAVAGGWVDRTPEVTRDTLFAQDRVVRHLHAQAAALLPMRFGSSLGDENQARDFVERRRTVLQEQLELVAEREQMTLRIFSETEGGTEGATSVPPHGAAKAAPSTPPHGLSAAARPENAARAEVDAAGLAAVGTRYLARRAEERVPPSLRIFVQRLQPIQRAMRVELPRHPELIATIYHLIDRGASDSYRNAVEDAARVERLNLRISGPSPAYAFASFKSASPAAPDPD